MRWMKAMSAMVMLMLVGAAGMAKDKKPAAAATEPVSFSTTLPSIEYSNQPLEKVLNQLKQELPGFDFSIARVNVPHDQPLLPPMTLQNVPLSELPQILRDNVPNLAVKESYGSGTAFFEVTIQKGSSSLTEPDLHVRVFGLAPIINYRAALKHGDGDHVKQASDDVLSLIQAALKETESPDKAEMKLHPPTEALICRITDEQLGVIQQVLDALQPTPPELRESKIPDTRPTTQP